MPGIFLGLKFQACALFWVCNMKLRRPPPPPVMYTSSTPWASDLTEPAKYDIDTTSTIGRQRRQETVWILPIKDKNQNLFDWYFSAASQIQDW